MKTIRAMTNRSGTKQVMVSDLNGQYVVSSVDIFTGTKMMHKRFSEGSTAALAQAFALAYSLRAR